MLSLDNYVNEYSKHMKICRDAQFSPPLLTFSAESFHRLCPDTSTSEFQEQELNIYEQDSVIPDLSYIESYRTSSVMVSLIKKLRYTFEKNFPVNIERIPID